MAARSIWKGTIGFGMVAVPIKMYPSGEDKTISLNQLHKACGSRLKMPKSCPTCNRTVEAAEIVKGYPLGDDKYVQVTEDDLTRVRLQSVKSIQIDSFVPKAVMDDPRRCADRNGYFLAPEEVGAKAFVLFVKAMAASGVAGIAKIAVREREQLCAVSPFDGILFLQTLRWADEVRNYHELIPMASVSEKEFGMGVKLIEALTKPTVEWEKYRDEYRDRLKEVLDAKIEGRQVEALPEPKAVMADLEAMLAGALAAAGK